MHAQCFVFLSHNSADKPAVEEIARRLRAADIEPWLDSWHLVPGEKWQPAVEKALTEARASVVFVGPSGMGPWQDEEMRVAIDRRVSDPAYRVVPVLLPGAQRGKRSAVPPFLANVTWVEFQRSLDEEQPFRRLIAGIAGGPPGAPIEVTVPGANPYRGLRVFDIDDSSLFFGREALTGWLLSDIRTSIGIRGDVRMLAIVGASGSGKSSLARAGLLAQLAAGAVVGSERWRYVILKPGVDPLESLATAGSEALALGADPKVILKFQDDLVDDARILHTQAALAMRGAPAGTRLLLLVDQFEEIFTLCADEDRRRVFIDNLVHAAAVADGPMVVVLTLRADFVGKCAAYPRLGAVLSHNQELVGPMTRDELHEAIERPAWQSGCEFQPGLVDVLLDDVEAQPGALPLLQHALFELWRQREGRRLTHDAYERIGRVEGALSRRADEVYRSFTQDEQAVAQRILLRLTQPGEGTEDTRRRAPLAEIIPSTEAAPTVERIVRRLADERLLVTEGETVDVAHEALIQGWPTLREWLDQDREGLREQRRVTMAAEEWRRLGRDKSTLYRGTRLEQALAWRNKSEEAINELEREFLDKSVAARDEEQRESSAMRRRRIASYAVLIGLVATFVASAVIQYAEADRAKRVLAARQVEGERTDVSGSLTVFGSSYGQEALEKPGRGKQDRGLFTALLEQHIFKEYTSVSQAVALTQGDLSGSGQRAEVLSSMNADIFLNPRNQARRFLALVAGWNHYDGPWPSLNGAVADAQTIYEGLVTAGYTATLLADASRSELEKALDQLMTEAEWGCVRASREPPIRNIRGIARVNLEPCENVLVFVYLAGHGFVSEGTTYLLPGGAGVTPERALPHNAVSIEALRGRIAERAAAQIIIADISRSALRRQNIEGGPDPRR